MSDDDFDIEDDLSGDDIAGGGRMQWLPRLVVAATVIGFIALAWYAYQTGTQTVNEDELVVVEAEKTPIKEKPEDPGGMKFPNQDKTVFETFAGNTTPPKVERVMPAPEEPRKLEMTDSKTLANEDAEKNEAAPAAGGKPEQLMGEDKPVSPQPLVKNVAKELAVAPVQKPSAIAPAAGNDVVSYTKDKAPQTAQEKTQVVVVQPVQKPGIVDKPVSMENPVVVSEKPVDVGMAEVKTKAVPVPEKEIKPFNPPAKTKTEAKAKPAKADNSGVKVQLGAYQSDKEARDAFAKLQKKFSSLAGKSPVVVKADLGTKGVFYRLRVGGFAGAADAKKFCGTLSAKGQACIVAK